MICRAPRFLDSLFLSAGILLTTFTTSAFAQLAEPTVIFSNLGTAGHFESGAGWLVTGPEYPDSYLVGWRVATRFTVPNAGHVKPPNASYVFDSAELPMSLYSGGNAVTVSLVSDAAGQPGKVLESTLLIDSLTRHDASLITARSSLNPTLAFGGAYWLMVDAPGDTLAIWNMNSISNQNPFMERQLTGAWRTPSNRTTPAFRVWGRLPTPIPEPGTVALLLSSSAALLLWRPRHRASR